METRESLLVGAADGDDLSCQTIFTLYADLVDNWCRRQYNMSQSDCDDIIQQVFISVFANLAQFKRERTGSFRKYLRTITNHKCVDYFRKQAKNPKLLGENSTNVDHLDEAMYDEDEEQKILTLRILELVVSKWPDKAGMIEDRIIRNRSYEDIAADYGMNKNAVETALSRFKARMKSIMDGLEDMADLPSLLEQLPDERKRRGPES